ncbi:hypothetical protein [Streptomyces sp. TE33382]
MENYPPEFKADAVALYESRPEATIRPVAADTAAVVLVSVLVRGFHGRVWV